MSTPSMRRSVVVLCGLMSLAVVLALHAQFPQAAICGTGYCHSTGGVVRRNSFHQRYKESDANGFLADPRLS